MSAEWYHKHNSKPKVSTRMCRLRPLIVALRVYLGLTLSMAFGREVALYLHFGLSLCGVEGIITDRTSQK